MIGPFRFRPGRGPSGPSRASIGISTIPFLVQVSPNSGRVSGGTAITITGRNFSLNSNGTAPIVTIDGVPATSVVVVDPATITAISPALTNEGIYDVVVFINGQSGILYNGFTVISAVITGITPAFGPLSGGTEVLISGYNFQTGSSVFFDETPATNVIVIDSTHIKATTPNHAVGFVDIRIVGP